MSRLPNLKHIELILKIAARCNINCQYCYFFYGADSSWKQKPKRMSDNTIAHVIKAIKQGVLEHNISSIQIDFHGGEPLLYGKEKLSNLCDLFLKELSDITNVHFALQTNAILIDQDWLDILSFYHINTAVSLDGPKTVNDLLRVDHKGHGTYDRTVRGIQCLQEAEKQQKIPPLCNLAVINPYTSGKIIYRHFVDDLKFKVFDFLLPGYDYDTFNQNDLPLYGDFLIDVLNEWINDNNPNIHIRFFEAFFAAMLGKQTFLYPESDFKKREAIALTIDSDGMMFGNDTLRSNAAWQQYYALDISQYTLTDLINQEHDWHEKNATQPKDCINCLWLDSCGGGHIENRYASHSGYNNPSIYCDSLQRIYHQLFTFLIDNGISIDALSLAH